MTRTQFFFFVILLGMFTGLMPFSIDTTLPSLPQIPAALGTDMASVQLSLSAFMLGTAVGQIVYGPASDRFGRKPVILTALIIYIGAGIACAEATSVTMLVVARGVQGFAACTTQILTRAVVRDRFDTTEGARALSYVMMIHGIFPIFGPILGAYVGVEFGWRSVFWMLVGYSAVLFVLMALFLRESIPVRDSEALNFRRIFRNYALFASDKVFVGYTATTICCYAGLFVYLTSSSQTIVSLMGETPEVFAVAFAVTMSGYLLGNFIGARLVRRMGLDPLIAVGVIGLAASGVLMLGADLGGSLNVYTLTATMFFFMLTYALIVPQAIANALAPFPTAAGAASSLLGFSQLAAGTAVGTVVAQISDGTSMPLTATIAAAGIVSCLIFFGPVRAMRRREAGNG